MTWTGILLVALAVNTACGGAAPTVSDSPQRPTRADSTRSASSAPAVDEDHYAPLDVGADYASYRKLTERPFHSRDHGNRWVDVYVNTIGAAAYLSGAPIPVGTIIVKTSWQDDGGAPSSIAGPIFVMEKRAAGYSAAHDDWYFAIHWAKPPPVEAAKFGGPIYWRGASPRAAYCWECHDLYDRHLGGLVSSTLLPR